MQQEATQEQQDPADGEAPNAAPAAVGTRPPQPRTAPPTETPAPPAAAPTPTPYANYGAPPPPPPAAWPRPQAPRPPPGRDIRVGAWTPQEVAYATRVADLYRAGSLPNVPT